MGRANPVLYFVVEDKWLNHPEFEPYKAQGHKFESLSQWLNGPGLRGFPDALLLENAFHWTEADFPYFAATIGTVRAQHRERIAALTTKQGGK
jgi:hypothetical protein